MFRNFNAAVSKTSAARIISEMICRSLSSGRRFRGGGPFKINYHVKDNLACENLSTTEKLKFENPHLTLISNWFTICLVGYTKRYRL